jgi:hypothetical protein
VARSILAGLIASVCRPSVVDLCRSLEIVDVNTFGVASYAFAVVAILWFTFPEVQRDQS